MAAPPHKAVELRTVRASRSLRWMVAAPDAVVVATVAVAVAAGLTVSIGQHRPWTTLPLALVIGWALWNATRPARYSRAWSNASPFNMSPSPSSREVRGARLVTVGTAVWTAINAVGAAQYLIVVRDPGFLTLSGLWLVHHPSTDIPARGAIEAAATQVNLLADASQAWNLRGDMIQPQGAKMLPATISVGGWIAGTPGVLIANIVIGAAGILAMYALARRFLGPMLALAPAGIVGLSVAHIGLSRAPYTEPLTLLLVVASMLWAWRGIEERRTGALVAAGVATGATALARIDGGAFAVGALVGVVIALSLVVAAGAVRRRWAISAVLAFVAAQLALVVVGYASLWRWSQAYIERLRPEASLLAVAYGATVAIAVLWAATWIPALRGERLLSAPASLLGRKGSAVVGGVVSAGLLVLASRPLWTTVHRGTETATDQFTNGVVEWMQQDAGLDIDPTRTYAEHTVTWLSYYLTWPVVILAILGFGVASVIAIRSRPAWALVLAAGLAPSVLYLLRPEIVPDQIWAIRRFEPATIPAFAIAASLGAWWAVSKAAPRLRQPHRRRLPAVVGALLMLAPVTSWVSVVPRDDYPVSVAMNVFTIEMNGARSQIDDLCALADGRPVVLAGTSSHFGSIRTRCDVPVVLALVSPTPQTLREITEVFGEPPVVLTRNPDWFTWTETPSVVLNSTVYRSQYRLQGIPRELSRSSYDWYAGLVTSDGEVSPIDPGEQALSAT